MGISKIGRLFVSNTDAIFQKRSSQAQGSDNRSQRSTTTASDADDATAGDAVIISRTIRTAASPGAAETDQSRADKVQQLKERVRNRTYSMDSDKIAIAVMKDLL